MCCTANHVLRSILYYQPLLLPSTCTSIRVSPSGTRLAQIEAYQAHLQLKANQDGEYAKVDEPSKCEAGNGEYACDFEKVWPLAGPQHSPHAVAYNFGCIVKGVPNIVPTRWRISLDVLLRWLGLL